MSKLIRSIWFLWLLGALLGVQAVTAHCCPKTLIGPIEQTEPRFVCDGIWLPALDYDFASVSSIASDKKPILGYDRRALLVANQEQNRTAGASGLSAKLAQFLAADSAATETFYRTMSQANYDALAATGKLPATSETFISPSLQYAQQYNGVTVQFNVQAGTQNALMGMGVRNSAAGFAGTAYEGLPAVQSGWTSSSAFFKWEGPDLINIGLGRGPALNTFNNSIVNFNLVPKP